MGNKPGSYIGSSAGGTSSGSTSSTDEVDLSSKGLTQFPVDLKEKVSNQQTANRITSLSLASNSLVDVDDLKALKCLKTLDLSRNRINVLTEELFLSWSCLESLNVSNNKLSALPLGSKSTIRNTLTILNASNNQIIQLSDELGDFTALKTMNFSYNQLKQLNCVWKSLSSLQTLHINNNQLTVISGASLISLVNVVMINAAENRLTKLPAEIGRLSNLTKLYLNNNQLKEIPSDIGQLRQLKELNLRSNKLTDLPSEIAYLWKLAVFDVEENPWPREEFYYELPELLSFLGETPRRPAKKSFGRGRKAGKSQDPTSSPKSTNTRKPDGFEVQAYRKRLFHVKGNHDIFVREVECKYQSFNQGDVFVLDSGSMVFVWMGEDSNDRERAKGTFFSRKLSEEECGSAHVLILDAANNEDSPLFAAGLDFWEQLGGRISILSSEEGVDDEEAEANWPSVNRLFRVTETGDRLDIEVIVGNDDLLSKNMLDSNHCFVLDCYSCTFVWAGSSSTPNEKSWALLKAEELQSRPRPASTGIYWIMDGDERITFRENFYDWIDPAWQKEIAIAKQEKENKKKILKSKTLDELLASPSNSIVSSPLQPAAVRPKAKTVSLPGTTSSKSQKEVEPPRPEEKPQKVEKVQKGRRETVANKPSVPETKLNVSQNEVQQQMFSLDLAIKGEASKQQVEPSPQPVSKRWPPVASTDKRKEREEKEKKEREEKEREEKERKKRDELEKKDREARNKKEKEEREAKDRKEKEEREKRDREQKEKRDREDREKREKDADQRKRVEAEAEENKRREQLQKEEQERERLRLEEEQKKTVDRQQQFKTELQRKESQLQLEKEADKKKEEARLAAVEKEQKEKRDKEDIERLEKTRREIDARLDQIKKEYEQKLKSEKEKRIAKLKSQREKAEKARQERDEREKKATEEKLRKEREEKERQEREEREKREAEERLKREKEEKERLEKEKKEELGREERERKAKEMALIEANETPSEKRERLRRERDERDSKMLKEQQERIEKIKKEKEEQERLLKEEKERLAKEKAELMAKLEADKKAREERERQERLARRRALETTAQTPNAPEEQPAVTSTLLRGPTRAAGPKRRVAATRNPVRALAARAEASGGGAGGGNVSDASRAAAAGAGGLLWSVGGENALSLWKKKQEDKKAGSAIAASGKPQRLYHIKGRRNPFVREVQFTWTSLNKGDVFIVDDGGSVIYQWNGCEANRIEKGKALDFAKKLKDKEHAGRPKIVVVEETEIASEHDHPLWQILGKSPNDQIDPANAAGEDQDAEKKLKDLTTLYIVNPEGAASVDDIELEVIEEYPLMKEMLLPSQSYILDCVGEIFPWTGKKSTVPSRNAAMSIAKKMVDARDFWVSPIKRELEGGESVIFKEKFANWASALPIQMKQVASGLNTAQSKKIEKIDVNKLHQPPPLKEEVMIDNGSGTPQVWRVEGNQKIVIPPEQFGEFHSGESYVILYKYTFKNKDQYLIYFWQGRDSSINEKGTSALMTIQLDESIGGIAKEIRVVQNKEPRHFIAIFKNRIIIHKGKANAATGNVRLYQIAEPNNSGEQIRAAEIDPTAAALNSYCGFVLTTSDMHYLWYGKAITSLEKEWTSTGNLTKNDKKKVKQFDEGNEPSEFWTAIGGKKEYPIKNRFIKRHKRLFQCSIGTGSFEVHEIHGFCQDDLVNDDAMILDTYDEIFVWIGKYAHETEKSMAMETAIDYAKTLPAERPSPVPLYVVYQPDEPFTFTSHFFAWDAKGKAQSFDDGLDSVEDVIVEYQKTYNYEELRGGFYPKTFDETKLETYLSESEFERVFGMTREQFATQTAWKKEDMKKALGLY